jgi:DNA polymerase
MEKLTIDFESRSPVDLRKTTCWVYAEHPDTQVMCCAFKVDDDLPHLFIPPSVFDLYNPGDLAAQNAFHVTSVLSVLAMLQSADIIEAHNLEFEISLWTHKMVPLGFPDLREEPYFSKLRCSASVASQHALPRSLGKVCQVLGTKNQKDDAGHKLMLKMCKPRTPRKAEKAANPGWMDMLWYHETPEDLLRQAIYCAQDVNTEHEVSSVLGQLPPKELEVWRLDQKANWSGVRVDTDLASKMIAIRDEHGELLADEFKSITGINVTQVTEFAKWLEDRIGRPVPSVDKASLEEILNEWSIGDTDYRHYDFGDHPTKHKYFDEDTKRAVEIRQEYAKTSLKKLDAAVSNTSSDGRMRSILMYHGASTGRWSGKGMQLQNLPSRGLIEDIDGCIGLIQMGLDAATLGCLYPDLQTALSSCIRSLLQSTPGKVLYAADFSAIEGRVLAWLAGDHHIVKAYENGDDLYKLAASLVYHVLPSEVTKDQRTVGKIPELAGGFGGGWRAYMAFAKTYGLVPPDEVLDSLTDFDFKDWQGNRLTMEEAGYQKWFDPMVKAWRANRAGTVRLWFEMECCARMAISSPGEVFGRKGTFFDYHGSKYEHSGILFGVSKRFLQIRLPSERKLYYFDPRLMEGGMLSYMGCDSSKGGAWLRQNTYGGKLVENIVQAVARDLMSEAMIRISKSGNGLRMLFTVHDEIICEGNPDAMTLGEYESMMSEPPEWAVGCPIDANGWIGNRYKKD